MIEMVRTKVYVWRELAVERGAMDVPPSWNKLLPDFQFMGVESFLKENVEGKAGTETRK